MTPEHTPDHTSLSTAVATNMEAFPYDSLQPKTADALREGADRIRKLTTSVTERLFAIGAELLRAKIHLGHGRFCAWVAAEFGWTERTAQRYMQATEVLGPKSDTVSVLEPTAIYQLSAKSTPEKVREAIVARLETGERPALAELKAEIGVARQAARREKASEAAQRAPWRAGAPMPLPPVTRARMAARFILARLGDLSPSLAQQLEGVDAGELVALLKKGEVPPAPGAVLSVELDKPDTTQEGA
ncbi:DUF3102 domain-containing protein [Methylobacterium phyllosphaerae]